ncbi:hypothetical protein AB0A77_36335 [Streptomyces varsoviensis]|uniref:hypothetical protein n=1 Tax=Streptomyces varsoviensis TaxID=67373 RepID=UPI0033CD5502
MAVMNQWPTTTAQKVEAALSAAARDLSALDARVEHYQVPEGGYAPLTGQTGSEVFSLEARLGPAHRRPGHSMWAVFQVFDPTQPNLALTRFLDRRDHDGLPDEDPRRPVYSIALDGRLCRTFLPVCNRALSRLDPTGRGRSQHVDSYPGRVSLGNLFQSPLLAVGMFHRFRTDGQAAVMIVDFTEPIAAPAVQLVKTVMARRDAHLIPSTTTKSAVHVLLRGQAGAVYQLGGMSSAVDQAIAIARQYLRQ